MSGPILLKGGNIIDFEKEQLIRKDIFITDGIIKSIPKKLPIECEIYNVKDKVISPGLIESHVHIESSFLPPLRFCHHAVQCGTTTILADPHEIVNVMGTPGIDLWLDQSKKVPLDLFVAIPSCVPAADVGHSGGKISLKDIDEYLDYDNVYGLGEIMDFPAII